MRGAQLLHSYSAGPENEETCPSLVTPQMSLSFYQPTQTSFQQKHTHTNPHTVHKESKTNAGETALGTSREYKTFVTGKVR